MVGMSRPLASRPPCRFLIHLSRVPTNTVMYGALLLEELATKSLITTQCSLRHKKRMNLKLMIVRRTALEKMLRSGNVYPARGATFFFRAQLLPFVSLHLLGKRPFDYNCPDHFQTSSISLVHILGVCLMEFCDSQ